MEITIKESDKSLQVAQDFIPFTSALTLMSLLPQYQKGLAYSAIKASDTINQAIGKLEAGLNALQDKVASMEGNGGDDTTDDPLS